jgi:hypothetical protein
MKSQLRRAAAGDLKAADKCWLLIVLEMWLREYDVEPIWSQSSGFDPRDLPVACAPVSS